MDILLNLPSIGVVYTKPSGEWIDFNHKFLSIIGYSHQQLIDITWKDITPKDDIEEELKEYSKFIESNDNYSQVEKRLIHKDGHYIYVKVSTSSVKNSKGDIDYLISLVEDISEQKMAHIKLDQARQSYQNLFNSVSESIFVIDNDGYIIDLNKSAQKSSGYSSAELIGKHYNSLSATNRNNNEEIEDIIADVFSNDIEKEFNFYAIDKLGEVRVFEAIANSGIYQDQKVIFVSSRDVTDKYALEEEMVKSRDEISSLSDNNRALLEAIPDLLFTFDKNGTIIAFKGENGQDLYLPPEEFIGKSIFEILPPDIASLTIEKLNYVFSTNRACIYNYSLPINGEISYFESRLVPSGIGKALSIVRNITESVNSQKELEKRDNLLEVVAKCDRILLSNENIDDSLPTILPMLGKAIDCDRSYAFEFYKEDDGELYMRQKYEWCNNGFEQQIENPILTKIPVATTAQRWYNILSSGDIICDEVKNLPLQEREILEPQEILSILVFPVFSNNICMGFIGFDACRFNRIWSDSEISILQSFVTTFGIALNNHMRVAEIKSEREKAIENEHYANELFEKSPISIIVCDSNGLTEKVNRGWEELWQLDSSIVVNKFNILTHPATIAVGWPEMLKDAFDGKYSYIGNIEFDPSTINGRGRKRIVNIVAFPIYLKHNLKKVVIISQDITDNHYHNNSLALQKEIAYGMFSSVNIDQLFMYIKEGLGKLMECENICLASYDKSNDTFSTIEYLDRHDNYKTWNGKRTLCGQVIYSKTTRCFNENDIDKLINRGVIDVVGTRCKQWVGVPIFDGTDIYGILVLQSYDNINAYSSRDIAIIEIVANDLRIFIEKRLSAENLIKLSKAVESNPASVVITNREGSIEYVNPKFTQTTGYNRDEAIGKNPRILKSGVHSPDIYRQLWKTISSGGEWRGELQNRTKTGEIIWEDVSISPILNDSGEITHYVGVKEDITKTKTLIQQLIEAKEKAEESDRLKSSFLQNISHEIRTPMNGILGFIELLEDASLSREEFDSYYAIIKQSSARMLNTVNDIIDISKIEAGIEEINEHTFSFGTFIQHNFKVFEKEIKDKGLSYSIKIDNHAANLNITTDYQKFYTIISNLIKNSSKYTLEGEVSISSYIKNGNLLIDIKDTGIGIPENNLDSIFERFVRGVNTEMNFEGTGIGLSIVKSYANLLGLEIKVRSKINQGSTFSVIIPGKLTTPNNEN